MSSVLKHAEEESHECLSKEALKEMISKEVGNALKDMNDKYKDVSDKYAELKAAQAKLKAAHA